MVKGTAARRIPVTENHPTLTDRDRRKWDYELGRCEGANCCLVSAEGAERATPPSDRNKISVASTIRPHATTKGEIS